MSKDRPNYYQLECGLECFDIMEELFGREAVQEYCVINAFTYLWRHKGKNGGEDVLKALRNLEKYAALESGKPVLEANEEPDAYEALQEMYSVLVAKYNRTLDEKITLEMTESKEIKRLKAALVKMAVTVGKMDLDCENCEYGCMRDEMDEDMLCNDCTLECRCRECKNKSSYEFDWRRVGLTREEML